MLKENRACITWTIPQFLRISSKTSSSEFGTESCLWELTIYPEGNGQTRGTHIGLFLDVVRSEKERQLGSAWRRPIVSFKLSVMSRSLREPLISKERHPANTEGYGQGFSHPRSWGWAAMLPKSRLSEVLAPNDTLAIRGEVVWHDTAELSSLVKQACSFAVGSGASFSSLLLSEWLSDVTFIVASDKQMTEESSLSSSQGCQDDGMDSDEHQNSVVEKMDSEYVDRRSDSDANSYSLDVDSSSNRRDGSIDMNAIQRPLVHSGKSSSTLMGTATEFPAHRAILVSRSEYFATMFKPFFAEGSDSGNKAIVNIVDFAAEDVRCMLEYIYCSDIISPPDTFEGRLRLLRLADRYQLPAMHSYIGTLIIDNDLNEETCLYILEVAQMYSSASQDFKQSCLRYVQSCLSSLRDKPHFKSWLLNTEHRGLLVEFFSLITA